MANTKYALVLSGGGFKGAFQVGALSYLFENGILKSDGTADPAKFSVIAGVSVGALNGAFLAMEDFDGLKALWQNVSDNGAGSIYTSDLVSVKGPKITPNFNAILRKLLPTNIFGSIFKFIINKEDFLKAVGQNFHSIKALTDSTPLHKQLKANIKISKFKIPFRMGFTSLETGIYHSPYISDFETDDNLAKAILASAALPIVFPPVNEITFKNTEGQLITTKQLTDGGVTNISPLGDVIEFIKTNDPTSDYKIIIINCSAEAENLKTQSFDLASTAFRVSNDLLTNEVLKNDTDNFIQFNSLVEQAASKGVTLKNKDGIPFIKFKYVIIQPNDPNIIGEDTGDTLDSSAGILRFRMAKGREMAEKALNEAIGGSNWT
jgi:NTE family protein